MFLPSGGVLIFSNGTDRAAKRMREFCESAVAVTK
jgi:hypothetical protein